MTNKLRVALVLALVVIMLSAAAVSPGAGAAADDAKPKPTPSLDQMTVGRCEVGGLSTDPDDIFERERRVGLVMDARTSAVNQAVGKLSFSGNAGRVTVVNMNPFVYSYKIEVAQKELVTTALNDFVKLLLPPALNKAVGLESGTAFLSLAPEKVAGPNKLNLIESRLNDFKLADCLKQAEVVPPAADAAAEAQRATNIANRMAQCEALGAMKEAFDRVRANEILRETGRAYLLITEPKIAGSPADQAFASYSLDLTRLRDAEAHSRTTCDRATALNTKLGGYGLDAHFKDLKEAQAAIDAAKVLANDLKDLVDAYGQDTQLKDSAPVVRCKGYNCVSQFSAYATAAQNILTAHTQLVTSRRGNAEEMRTMLRLTDEMKGKEGLFARTFPVFKKFELSEATITITPEPLPTPQRGAGGTQSGSANPADGANALGAAVAAGGAASGGAAPFDPNLGRLESGTPAAVTPSPSPTPATRAAGNAAASGRGNTRFTIGRPRFALSGGLVYSPLPRRTFTSVKGFVRDAQGNPTGDGSANVVGFGENSSRRLTPMVQLNTRLADLDPVTLYFSMGVSAKYDDNLDIEYLFGPSVGLLDNRLLFTAGAYAGRTQNLVPDVAVGDVLPDTLGDAKLFRKSHTWKPGFSFSYFFTRPASATANNEGGGGTSTPSATGTRSEIRIGGIPFNIAAGMIFTTLEQRTYDEVAGFARNRQGDLTNGETLTRIVGRASSADYRVTPAVLLHSRLTDFRRHNFYFSAGVTGKKTDNDFDIEYLLGGSVNVLPKLFLTFGTFVGKQRTLGGDFFEGAALAKTQNVTTVDRYVWKPAFSFSYDMTRFIPGTNPPR